MTSAALAEDYVAGQNAGLQKCVRAILGGYEVKGVSIFGHKFNCKKAVSTNAANTGFQLSHDQFGVDDQVFVFFKLNNINVYRTRTLRISVLNAGPLTKLPKFQFKGRAPNEPSLAADTYAGQVEFARALRRLKSDVSEWERAPWFVAAVVIAELGNPENRGVAPRQVNCDRPTFYVHDNFKGPSVRFSPQPDPDLHDKGGKFADSISSVCVPRGWVVRAFEHKKYKGKMLEITGPKQYEDLKRQLGWGDRISSIAAFRRSN
jgi:hypothetical protein